MAGGIDRITPETAKEILGSFEGATKEDLLDPDTWKGVWYMLNYSLQFQAEQLLQRFGRESEEAGEPGETDEPEETGESRETDEPEETGEPE